MEYYGPRPTAVTVIIPAKIVELLKRHIQTDGLTDEEAQKIDALVSDYSFEYYLDEKRKNVKAEKE